MAVRIAFSNIAIEMKQRKITVEEMAEVIGVTPSTMRKKLCRKTAIKLDEAVRKIGRASCRERVFGLV